MDELNPSNKGEDRLSDESPWPSSSPSASSSAPGGWRPSQLVFHPYSPLQETAPKSAALRVFVRKPLVARLTKDIVETYQICNPQFKYSEELNRKRYLTSPADGVLNGGHDNANSDLILTVNYVLVNSQRQQRYIVKDILGQGTFGQVAKCWVPEVNNFVAVKIIKNQPAYYQQALVEVSILTTLNNRFDPEDKHHIIRIYDYFVFQRHLCISFELLGTNLYELIKLNNFRGLSLSIVQLFSKQILRGLALMKEAGIIHCDLKPENILLCTSMKPAEIKIIDFGSACVEEHTVYSYIQSRYYRSPEVLLGYQYTTAIDMWSFGCIVAELFLGLPLFPGASEFDLLKRMIRILGGQPPDYLLKEAKNTSKFFKYVGIADRADAQDIKFGGNSAYRPFTEEEYEARENKKPIIGKEYFNYMDLEAIVAAYPCRKNLPEEDVIKERQVRLALIDFLRGLVEFDPAKRWSPFQASKHPFVTGEPFTCPYKPPPETPHMPVMQSFKVEHHPGGGHWFVAGLSPNVSGRNIPIHASPRFQMVPYAHGSSYGSLGSHGSYNDCNGLGSSYGSYGDNLGTFTYFSPAGPSGMNIHTQGGMTMFQSSPDTRWRMIHRPPGLGASPSAGNVVPLPLGTSPSQFTPPNTFSHVSGSPGQYGSVSPAWGNSQGSPLGKGEAVSHFSRRRSWGYSGSIPSQDGASSSYRRGQFNESNPQMPGGPPLHMPSSSNVGSWKQPQESVSSSIEYSPFRSMPSFFMHGSGLKGASSDKLDTHLSLPDPGDWDPNYSDELLLEEDNVDLSCITSEFNRGVQINQAPISVDTSGGIGRHGHDARTSSNIEGQRTNESTQGFPQVEMGSPPSVYNLHAGYGHSLPKASPFLPHMTQNSPSRLGQQYGQQFHHWRPSAIHGNDGTHIKWQPSPFGFSSGGPHSPRSSSFSNGTSWGRRTNYPLADIPPPSRGRKDYGRIV